MKIIIETIAHKRQRYPTVGDWFYKRGVLHIRVSKLCCCRREALIAVHELVEALLCRGANISERSVTAFDKKLLKAGGTMEPGDHVLAPYQRQHCIATGIERLLAAELGVYWADYEKELEHLEREL